jgi:hypothetical protein
MTVIRDDEPQPNVNQPTLIDRFFADNEVKRESLQQTNLYEFNRYRDLVSNGLIDYLRDACQGKSWKQLAKEEQIKAGTFVVKKQLRQYMGEGYTTEDSKDQQASVQWSAKHDWFAGGLTVTCLFKVFEKSFDMSKKFISIQYDVYLDVDGRLKSFIKTWSEMDCEGYNPNDE